MLCKNCGCVLSNDADICYSCGTPVRDDLKNEALYKLDDPAEQPAPEETEETGELAQSSAVTVDNAQKASIYARFFSFFFALIGLILFGVQRKNGEEAKAVSIADAIMTGLCAKMGVAICYLVFAYMIHR